MKLINNLLILAIKFYKYFISPCFHSNCRYLPTCSEYFIDCLKFNGTFKGLWLGTKRILRCHPIKFLGGGSGFDPAPNLKKGKK
ncbi:membrane protein insertion efficiency factor YidD [Pelagibacteraceae bacterium]|nr:membrane protein insertion efficiency factor YidD [Pelagibacteraceae bacterium]